MSRWTDKEALRLAVKLGNAAMQAAPTAKQKLQALGRLPAGTMNKTEAAYAAHLAARQAAGELAWFKFEGVKLRLADATFYSPDFAVMLAGGALQMHEVKGGIWQDDSRVKIKVAASLYPFAFIGVMPRAKKDGGGWIFEEF